MKTIEYYMDLPYRLELVPDTEEGGFIGIPSGRIRPSGFGISTRRTA